MTTCPSCGGLLGRDCFNPQECAEITSDMARQALEQRFEPCAIVFDDPKRTELVIRDCAVKWVFHEMAVDIAYDIETNELVGVRFYGDVLNEPQESGSKHEAR